MRVEHGGFAASVAQGSAFPVLRVSKSGEAEPRREGAGKTAVRQSLTARDAAQPQGAAGMLSIIRI